MRRARGVLWAGALLAVLALLAAACGPAAEPTATTAPAQPTATTAPAAPTATTAPGQPTATTAPAEVKLRPVPVLAYPAPNPNAQFGGVFRELTTASPTSFHSWESCCGDPGDINANRLTTHNTYEPNKDEQILPELAYDWWTDESGLQWTLKLREGVKFQDGEAFTCADAKFSLDTLRLGQDAQGSELISNPKGPVLQRIAETRCVDDFTLELETDGPMPALIPNLALPNFAIFPQHWLEGNQARARDEAVPATGPFVFNEYVPTEFVSYTRNPNYWNDPYPYLDEVRFLDMGAITALWAAFRVGRAEYMKGHLSLPAAQREQMISEGRLVAEPNMVSQGIRALHTNWQRAPWNDPRFALALRCATDSAKFNATSLDGMEFESPIFPLATLNGGTEWGLTNEEWKAIGPCHGTTAETDMEQRKQIARDLMAKMGFTAANPAKPDTVMWRQQMADQFAPIMDDWADINVQPQLRVEVAAAYSVAYAGEFDIIGWSFQSYRKDPDQWLYEHYYSTSDRNYGKYTNAEVDALIDLQSRTLDLEERRALVKQISTKLLQDNAKIIQTHRPFIHIDAPWVKDHYHYTFAASLHTSAWIDKAIFDRLGG